MSDPFVVQETRRLGESALYRGPEELGGLLVWMRRYGSSVLLTWGEDTGQWECSWITGGRRYTGWHSTATGAAARALIRVGEAERGGR